MATTNPITGDAIKSRSNSKEFESNYEKIFGKKSQDNSKPAEVKESAPKK